MVPKAVAVSTALKHCASVCVSDRDGQHVLTHQPAQLVMQVVQVLSTILLIASLIAHSVCEQTCLQHVAVAEFTFSVPHEAGTAHLVRVQRLQQSVWGFEILDGMVSTVAVDNTTNPITFGNLFDESLCPSVQREVLPYLKSPDQIRKSAGGNSHDIRLLYHNKFDRFVYRTGTTLARKLMTPVLHLTLVLQ